MRYMASNLILSALGIALGVGGFFLASWRASKPHDKPEPRLIPWRFVMMACILFVLLIVAYLMNLAGIETGPDKSPFGRF